ncbi:MAG: sugar phosphate nucleotidyltransferase [Gemmatimonadota bacterium]|nr:MAG: sugar phosphate nucleotidyltransferase [Gemmatimonadota bacterium]
MKAIIPLAGKGSRLRPHTFATPKPLLRVGGRPVMSYILDDLRRLGVEEIVFVVGYLRDVVREYIETEYPDITGHYVVQEVQDGTAGALRLAAPYVDEDVLILFVDTLFDADLTLVRSLPEEWAGVIWAKEVEDYQRFGVILTDDSGAMTRIVEKPSEPISRLANIGLYYIRDHKLLFEGVEHTMKSSAGPSGEYYLTDAFQYMVDHGARICTAPVDGWYDCGKLETLLDTNRYLLETTRGGLDPDAVLENTTVVDPVRLEEGVVVRDSSVGPNVTLERGVVVEASTLADVIVGDGASIESSSLHDSMVGSRARISGFSGSLSVAADSEVAG